MTNIVCAFSYKDHLTGELLVDPEHPLRKRPYSHVFEGGYKAKHAKLIDQVVENARNGQVLGRVDALMTLSYFLERKWPIPDSLSEYAAEAIEKAVVAFGHTEGRLEKKNAAVCNALGLFMPKGPPKTQETLFRRRMVHSYIWWRKKLFKETLRKAATKAVKAFDKTGGITHDNCEKMYESVEMERSMTPSIGLFVDICLYPEEFRACCGDIYFSDNDFMLAVIKEKTRVYECSDEIPQEYLILTSRLTVSSQPHA